MPMNERDDDLREELRELLLDRATPSDESRMRAREALMREVSSERERSSRAKRFRAPGRGLMVTLVALALGSGGAALATNLASSPEVHRSDTEPTVYGFERIPREAAHRIARRAEGSDVSNADLNECRSLQRAGAVDRRCALLLAAQRNGDLKPTDEP